MVSRNATKDNKRGGESDQIESEKNRMDRDGGRGYDEDVARTCYGSTSYLLKYLE